jgi:deoxyribonuclease V
VIVAVDVQYEEGLARAAGVGFDAWTDAKERASKILTREVPADYQPGHFFERELPCILPVLRAFLDEGPVSLVLVDGYVDLGPERPGLGRVLFDTLERRIPIVGVAKTSFHDAPARSVLRGASKSPLFVTATFDVDEAARRVQEMAGQFRIPTLLKRVDRLARGDA